jgi:hypothetical protein
MAVQRVIGDKGRHDKRVGTGDVLGGLSFDPLGEFENVQRSVERRIAPHENTRIAAASIRPSRHG